MAAEAAAACLLQALQLSAANAINAPTLKRRTKTKPQALPLCLVVTVEGN